MMLSSSAYLSSCAKSVSFLWVICYSCWWYHSRVANSSLIKNICSHIPDTNITLRILLYKLWTSVWNLRKPVSLEHLTAIWNLPTNLDWPHPRSHYLDNSVKNLNWPGLIRVTITRYSSETKHKQTPSSLFCEVYRVVNNQRITA